MEAATTKTFSESIFGQAPSLMHLFLWVWFQKASEYTRKPARYCKINHQKRSGCTFCRSLCPCVGEGEWASRILNSLLRDDQRKKKMQKSKGLGEEGENAF